MALSMVCAITIFVMCLSVSYLHADTGSALSDGSQGTASTFFQIQNLINQESMLRYKLDGQLQDLRSLVNDLKSKLEQSDERCKAQTGILESKIVDLIKVMNEKFSVSQENENQLARNLSVYQDEIIALGQTFLTRDENLNKSLQRLSSETSERFSAMDNTVRDLQLNASLLEGRAVDSKQRKHAYFSATLSSTYTTRKSPDVIKFDNVSVNRGNAYNPTTGIFTCPESGTYLLSFSFMNSDSNIRVNARIFLNDSKTLLYAVALEDNVFNTGVGTILYPLQKGDKVKVIVDEIGSTIYGHYFTTFSGMLISEE